MPERSPRGPALAAAACAAAAAALTAAVASGATASVDVPLSRAAVAAAVDSPGLTRAAQVVEHVTEPVWLYLAALVGVAACARSGRRRQALWALLAGAVAAVASPVLKALVGRTRPALDAGLTGSDGGAFPSGHSFAAATVVLGALVLLLPPARSRARLALRAAAGALVLLLIGVDRVWLGAHWPTDVLGGWLMGAALVALAAALAARGRPATGRPAPGGPGPGVRARR
ncbi:phosphatase PAP2 family protein [Paenibacillus sp. TRM 82003]|uniref:phosphatase PAP2 family protein n=1 Tax=Kineococcus sp. TRM81007 TaxID=2925831 RepID=UPI001F590577|nr:phosphatase PAP2 family protein [Kineococcus sp. TRM81007]MCI2238994.1 phosphatase PAP2 family protein [Kineococcus sp. TRM81007]MCI3924414.1 phosphatase PAP2 family protein [Paenibacillus sp. TRM 82003]